MACDMGNLHALLKLIKVHVYLILIILYLLYVFKKKFSACEPEDLNIGRKTFLLLLFNIED